MKSNEEIIKEMVSEMPYTITENAHLYILEAMHLAQIEAVKATISKCADTAWLHHPQNACNAIRELDPAAILKEMEVKG